MKTLTEDMPFSEIIEVVKETAIKSRKDPENAELKKQLNDMRKFCANNDIEGLYQEGRNQARTES